MAFRESTQRGTIEVGEPFQIICLSCKGIGWTIKDWQYQQYLDLTLPMIVQRCSACNGEKTQTVVEMLSANHEHTFVEHHPPEQDNNWQGTFICSDSNCGIVIMGLMMKCLKV